MVSPTTAAPLADATGNATSDPLGAIVPYHPALLALVGFVVLVLSAVTIFGNLLVLIAFYVDKNIRQPSNYFILSLAISDFIIGIEGFPFLTVLVLKQYWPLGWFICDLWLSIDYTVCLASIYTVLLITIDRYCSVRMPTLYRSWRTPRKIQVMIVIVWIVPTLLFFISIFGWSWFVGERVIGAYECEVQFMRNPIFNMSMYITYYWSTLIVMIVLYGGIYRAAYKLQRKSERRIRKMSYIKKLGDPNAQEVPLRKGDTAAGTGGSGDQRDASPKKSSSTIFTSDADPETTSQSRKRKGKKKTRKFTTKRFFGRGKNQLSSQVSTTHSKKEYSFSPISCHKDSETVLMCQQQGHTLTVPTMSFLDDPGISCSVMVTDTQIHPESSRSVSPSTPNPALPCPVPKFGLDSDPEEDERSQWSKHLKFIDHDSISKTFASDSIVESSCSGGTPIREDLFSTGTVALTDVCQEFSCISYMSRDDVRISIRTPKNARVCRMKRERSSSLNTNARRSSGRARAGARLRGVKSNPVAPMILDDYARDPVRPLLLSANYQPPVVPLTHMERIDPEIQGTARLNFFRRLFHRFSLYKAAKRKALDHNGISKRFSFSATGPKTSFREAIFNALKREPTGDYQKSKKENRARKALRVITVILGAFIFFWTPFYVIATVVGFKPELVPGWLFNLSYYLCYLNSTINPFCYALANAQFKKVFLRLLKGDLHVS